MKRKADANWEGTLKEGRGVTSTPSGALRDTPYSFGTRFGDAEPGESQTNPEELIAAAAASCFSMALSKAMGEAGISPVEIRTVAELDLNITDSGPEWTALHLHVEALEVDGLDVDKLTALVADTEKGCPIYLLLAPGVKNSAVTSALVR
ncbi:OsmC family protein [soil metagenome]